MSLSIDEVYEKFPTHDACIKHIEMVRWKGVPVCPYCGSLKSIPRKKEFLQKSQRHQCGDCNTSYSVIVGTLFQGTHMSLKKWFVMISIMLDAAKSMSARQMSRHLKINKDTAWKNMMKIREAMGNDMEMLKGLVEIDATWFGPKRDRMNKKAKKKNPKTGTGYSGMTGLMGMKERGGAMHFSLIQTESAKYMAGPLRLYVEKSATIISDTCGGLYHVGKEYAGHEKLSHEKEEYRRGEFHTNHIEGFWNLMKRGLIGQWHKVSDKWLVMYAREFAFRDEYRNHEDKFGLLLGKILRG